MSDVTTGQPRPGRLFAQRYRLGKRRGDAVDAATFDAVDTQLQRKVIIKLVHPELGDNPTLRASIESGIQAAASVRHPNLAHVLDFGAAPWNDHEVLFVVEELLAGGSLRELLDRGRTLSPSQALLVGLDACKALDTLHRNDIVHGDIRPSSLVFGDDQRLRVVDTGLAGPLAAVQFADTGHVANDRAAYASPEAATRQPLVPQSDVYALCLTLVEAVTGKVPFVGDSAVATLGNRVGKLMPVSADLGPLAPVFERAGRPDIDTRSTAAEFGRALMQTAERLPRPKPIALLSGGVFADPVSAGQPVDPTGPVVRPPVATPPSAAPAAPVTAGSPATDDLPTAAISITGPTAPHTDLRVIVDAAPIGVNLDPSSLPTQVVAAPAPPAVAAASPPVVPAAPPASRRRGMRRSLLAAILAVIVIGGLGVSWWLTRPTIETVPQLVGLTEAEALNTLSAYSFTTDVTRQPSDDVDSGVVISTDPVAGTQLNVETPLGIVISSGPAPRELPELTGLTLDQARQALADVDLVLVEDDAEFSEDVAAGTVIRWVVAELPTLTAGATVAKGTDVHVVVSAGPQPRTVPPLGGLTLEEATQTLDDLGLQIEVLPEEFSATVEKGLVVRQSPTDGESIERGGTVGVALSKGPELVRLPNLVGLTVEQAQLTLSNAGLVLGNVLGDATGLIVNVQFNNQPLSAGIEIAKGTAIDVVTGAPAPTTGSTTTSTTTA